VEPKPIPGRPSSKGVKLRSWLPKHLVEANVDLTLEEHREAFEEEFGQKTVSTSTTIGRAIAGLPDGGGWPIKKSRR
jgi:hypothetical protein